MSLSGGIAFAILGGTSRAWDSTWQCANSPRQDDLPGGDFRRSIRAIWGTRTIDAESPDFMRVHNQRLRRTGRLFCQTNQWLAALMIHRSLVARAPSLRPAPGSADDGSVPAETPSPHASCCS